MPNDKRQPRNVIFWGAGATAALGIRTTLEQGRFLRCLADVRSPDKVVEAAARPLKGRIDDALSRSCADRWRSALFDLITILGDSEASRRSIGRVDDEQIDAMRRNWRLDSSDDQLRERIVGFRVVYDWPALKSVIGICPGSSTERFKLNDLFNVLDMHISSGHGVRVPSRRGALADGPEPEGQFLDARRLIGAKNALLIILIASFYIDYQECLASKSRCLRHYYDFATLLARRMQRQGLDLAVQQGLDQPSFYQGDVGFVSLNYDPIVLWMQFLANRDLNNSAGVPHIGSPAVPLQIFHDFGHLIPARRIGQGSDSWPWYPMNEGAAQRLNEVKAGGDHKVRLIKFLFPHGCLCWRECPDCGKLSTYHPDNWSLHDPRLFPPPPLLAFDRGAVPDWITDEEERSQRENGRVDARKCLHCGTLTQAHHTQAVMQSSFKPRPPSFIEEIQRDLRATTMRADHIIFMGYSFPVDDVAYRAFFSARCQRGKVHCTVVTKDGDNPGWYVRDELKRRRLNGVFREDSPVHAACDIFGIDSVRFYGGGIPDVFLDEGRAADSKLEQLLTLAW